MVGSSLRGKFYKSFFFPFVVSIVVSCTRGGRGSASEKIKRSADLALQL